MQAVTGKQLLMSMLVACGCVGATRPGSAESSAAAGEKNAGELSTKVPANKPSKELIPRAVLVANPERTGALISPDGKWISWQAPYDGVLNVWVAKITKPLLIVHGANDPRVKKSESDQIVAAMKAKGIPVSYVVFPDEGHSIQRPENSRAFIAVTEAFLSAHLGGWYEPIDEAEISASSMVIEAGREWLPGLPKR